MVKDNKIAVLITTYNRSIETKRCLDCLNKLKINFFVFIADSNSQEKLKLPDYKYLKVKVFNIGNDIFWNRGMNISWTKSNEEFIFDFYIWLNNDTFLYENSFSTIINDFNFCEKNSIIIGTTEDDTKLTYGGRLKLKKEVITPNGKPQNVIYMNGNFVLISKNVFDKVGYLNNKFQHSLGDLDYGLRAIKKGIKLYASSQVIGYCKKNEYKWYDEKSFFLRLKKLNAPKGVPLVEYFYFNKVHFGFLQALKFLISTLTALVSPKLYKRLS